MMRSTPPTDATTANSVCWSGEGTMSGVVEGDDTNDAIFIVHIDVASVVVACCVMMIAGGVELMVVSGTGLDVWSEWFVIGRSAHVTLSVTWKNDNIEQCPLA